MDFVLIIGVASLVVAVISGALVYGSKRNSEKQTEIQRQAYVESRPCHLTPVVRIAAVELSPTGGIALHMAVRNDGLGRAFNIVCEARSAFLRDFDDQRTVRKAQTLNLMRRDKGGSRVKNLYAPFGFDERLDMPLHIRDAGSKYLEPDQRHILDHRFFVPWQYIGHPSSRLLTPLEEFPSPETLERMEAWDEVMESGLSEEKLTAFSARYGKREPLCEEVRSSETRYERDESLPPGMLLYGEHSSGYGVRGRWFLYGPGNGLQLTLRFSDCEGSVTKYFALPCPLLVFHPEDGVEIQLVETDVQGVELFNQRSIAVY